MAERSKAPDSRSNTFPEHNGSGRSGLRMEAWVRIPLLTICFFFLFSRYLSHKNVKLERAAASSISNLRDSVSSIQTPRNLILKPTSSPESLSLTLPDFKVTGTLRKQRQVTLICLFCFWFSNWPCLWVQSKLFDENTMANNSLPLTSPDYLRYDENRHLITNCWSPRFLLKLVYHRRKHGMVNLDIMVVIPRCQDGRAV